MNYKKLLFSIMILSFLSSCQTIKNKSDAIAEKENKKYGQLVGKKLNELKIELGNPTEDYVNESGNKVLVYETKKYGIPCERKFEINQKNIIESFTSSGCI